MIAPDDPRDLTEALLDIDPMQAEIGLIWGHLQESGWSLVSYPQVSLDGHERFYTVVDRSDHALPGGADSICRVVRSCALAQMLRDPDEAGRMGQILLDCGWRSEVKDDQMSLVLDQPLGVRESLMAVLDPDAPGIGGQPALWAYPANLNALVPGHPTAQAMLEILAPRMAPHATMSEIRRVAGIAVQGGSMGECLLAALKKLEDLTWT